MSKWKNKHSYLESLDRIHETAKKKIQKKGYVTNNYDIHCNANAEYLAKIKESLSDELFESIAYLKLNLNFFDLLVIMSAEKEIKTFRQFGHAENRQDLQKEIETLKKNVKSLSRYSCDDYIRIKLPTTPRETLALVLKYFKQRKMSQAKIDDIFSIFTENSTTHKPRSDMKIIKKIMAEIDEIVQVLIKDGSTDPIDNSLAMIQKKMNNIIYYECRVADLKS